MTFSCSRKRLWITAVMRRRALSLVWRFPGAEAGARRDLQDSGSKEEGIVLVNLDVRTMVSPLL